MKGRITILFLSLLLLLAVGYAQVVQKLMADHHFSVNIINDVNDEAEENNQEASEESRETDQDEDPFSINDAMIISSGSSTVNLKNANYSLGQVGYYPEIVSPPPQA